MTKEYFKVIPAVCLLLIKDNKILLLRRSNTGYEDGNYTFISGHVEKGETIIEAMAREAKEEGRIDIKIEDMKLVHVMYRNAADSQRVDFFISATKWNGEPRNVEPEKCSDLSWFDINKIPKNIVKYIPIVINKINNKEFYSDYGFDTV